MRLPLFKGKYSETMHGASILIAEPCLQVLLVVLDSPLHC